jgi:hypothetical protein
MFLWPPAVPAPTVTQVKVDGNSAICDIEETFTSIITVSFVDPYARTGIKFNWVKSNTENKIIIKIILIAVRIIFFYTI